MADITLYLFLILLIAAMLAASLRWMRILALGACAAGLAHYAVGDDRVAAVLAGILGFVALLQLLILLRRSRTGGMSAEERELLEQILAIEDPANQRRLLGLIEWRDMGEGQALMKQGERDPPLVYLAQGAALIAHDGIQVGEAGKGDFLGEMSLVTGATASASVTVTKAARVARFDRDALVQVSRAIPEIGKALDGALNRSLVAKVIRMNEAATKE